jgi:hypothetical protein
MNEFLDFLKPAYETGLGLLQRNEQPKPTPPPKPPKEDSKLLRYVLIGAGVVVVILTLGLVFKKK